MAKASGKYHGMDKNGLMILNVSGAESGCAFTGRRVQPRWMYCTPCWPVPSDLLVQPPNKVLQ